VRALPHVESLSLFKAEEGQEEIDARVKMGIVTMAEAALPSGTQEPMDGTTNTAVALPPSEPDPPTPIVSTTSLTATQSTSTIAPQPQIPMPAIATATAGHSEQTIMDNAKSIASTFAEPSIRPPAVFTGSSSSTAANKSVPSLADVDSLSIVRPITVDEDEDEDEPMPSIDMDSDSDSE
jgi:hypothetical protein